MKIPKSWLRTFFRVLRVLTMGFVQPPSHTDAAPATAVGESLQVDAFFHRLYPGAYLHNQGVPAYGFVRPFPLGLSRQPIETCFLLPSHAPRRCCVGVLGRGRSCGRGCPTPSSRA